jgi:hypothetical protein
LFESSGKVRVNAQGKRLDAWLVYNCIACKNSWNRPIFERRSVREVEAPLMNALLRNDPDYVRRLAFEVEDLRRRSERIAEFPDVNVRKEALNKPMSSVGMLELRLVAPFPVSLRFDRLLATELKLSRARVEIVVHNSSRPCGKLSATLCMIARKANFRDFFALLDRKPPKLGSA